MPSVVATLRRRGLRVAAAAAVLAVAAALSSRATAWSALSPQPTVEGSRQLRRAILCSASSVTVLAKGGASVAEPATVTTASGLKYQDFRDGTGDPPKPGTRVTIDYVMMTTGARYGNKIDSTKDREVPYSFVLGDPAVITGLSEAVGTMRPGGIRRVIIPATLGYTDVTKQPVPPNPSRYQPDLVFDVKLFSFGK
mmetsp:Transcript_99549/g.310732  ORF Transcript_99549/g.310732 Transcript_99549/m.310732 type:complete len:196 (+) Transcript_99549:65-652(+)